MNEVTKELGIAARGGIIALIGMVVSALFGFFTRTVIGRVYGPSAYGAYNVAFTIFNLAVVVVLLGFPLGLQRQVSYFKEKMPQRLERLIFTALILVVISSSLGMVFVE
ncbi:MAG: oligosaccharide flippase family protein, partial [Thermococcus sp.]